MRASIIAAIAATSLCAVETAAAQEAQAEGDAEASNPVEVIRTTDAALSCAQISEEAAQLSESMGGDPGGGSVFSRLGGVAKAGAAMLIPGAGLATAAADAVTAPGRDRREAAELSVQHRWYYLNGLYAGHGCQAQAEAALAPAAPAAVIPPAAVTRTPSVATPTTASAIPPVAAPAATASAATSPATPPPVATTPR